MPIGNEYFQLNPFQCTLRKNPQCIRAVHELYQELAGGWMTWKVGPYPFVPDAGSREWEQVPDEFLLQIQGGFDSAQSLPELWALFGDLAPHLTEMVQVAGLSCGIPFMFWVGKAKLPDQEQVGTGDLRVTEEFSNGFVMLSLYDADDGLKFYLPEDDLVPLRNKLNEVIKRHKLE